jgi:MinD-like ATPase involved in chromosome partitioning or flagellar assembly
VLISCWSAKGGVGTTVVAAALALVLAGREPAGVVLADLAGDVPAVLGLAPVESAGLAGWLAAGPSVPADALARLEVPVAAGLGVLPRGSGRLDAGRAGVLATLLGRGNRPVVVDCGRGGGPPGDASPTAAEVVVSAAVPSLLVVRPCFVALQHALRVGTRPTGVVVVREPGRVLHRHDVERVVGAPVVAEVEADPAVSRAVDAGLLAVPRLPRSLARALRHAA